MLRQLSTRLARRGHEVHVATTKFGVSRNEELRDAVFVHRFELSGHAAFGIKGDPAAYLDLVRSRSWDVIAMHCAQIWTTDLLLPYLRGIAATKVFVGHGLLIFESIGVTSQILIYFCWPIYSGLRQRSHRSSLGSKWRRIPLLL